MPVCHPIKAIFVHIPRCGGTSINSYLHKSGYFSPEHKILNVRQLDIYNMYGIYDFEGNKYELDHATAEVYRMFVGTAYLEKYFKFTIVRNPYTRLYSEYKRKVIRNDKRFIDIANLSFNQFVHKLHDIFEEVDNGAKNHFSVSHFIPQYHYAFDSTGTSFVDYVGKFEKLDDHWLEICDRLSIEREKLPFLFAIPEEKVVSNSINNNYLYQNQWNRETKSLIYTMYSKDFEYFGYEPDI